LRNANRANDFQALDRHLPVKNLNLRANEELFVQRAKKRPGIIIASKVDIFPEITNLLRQKGRPHLQQDSIFVIPIYSIENEEKKSGFPQEIVTKTLCLLYKQFFYLPNGKSFKEGIARFDRVQVVVSRDRAAIVPMDICLSQDVLNLFFGLFIYCLTGVEDPDIKVARDLIKETYSPEL
jgi:hypothetical protein